MVDAAAGRVERRAMMRKGQHDMRTRLGQILGYGEILEEELRDRDLLELIPDLERIRDAANALLDLVDGVFRPDAAVVPRVGVESAATTSREPLLVGHSGRLLIVDDEPSNRELLTRMLSSTGYEVVEAASGRAAMSLTQSGEFDLVLLDVLMPEMNGIETLQAIRRTHPVAELPVIMTTALAGAEDVVAALESGANDFVSRPFDRAVVVARIETQLALRATTKRLISQEKLASLGTLTAGVAHEIRNPLNFIKNFVEASLDSLESADQLLSEDELDRGKLLEVTSELTSSLTLIPKHVSRIDSVVTNMLGFSQDYLAALQLTDIGDLVSTFTDLGYQGYRGMGHQDFVARVNVKAPEPVRARVYPQEIGRVVVNLVTNACDAMRSLKDQGISRQPELDIQVERIGEEFGIKVRDNGVGIPVNLREHVFVPFFTTKPPGEGTGLGLGLCRDIVIGLHNGEMEMESEPGVGTTVRITIPISEVSEASSPSPA